jgi:hypothetical protein
MRNEDCGMQSGGTKEQPIPLGMRENLRPSIRTFTVGLFEPIRRVRIALERK